MSEIPFCEPSRRPPATLLFALLLGLNAIAADAPSLPGIVIEVPTPPTPIPAQPYPLLFATISGAHLYGFPSPDSDYDLRGRMRCPSTRLPGWKCGTRIANASQNRNLVAIARRLNSS